MNTKDPSPTAESPQGGYGSPNPEDELPDAATTTTEAATPESSGGKQDKTRGGEKSSDPLLKPLRPSEKDPQRTVVTEEDLENASIIEPPD
ncbi:MAG: hypothetical protein WBX27_14115 [Specibacter sp.]